VYRGALVFSPFQGGLRHGCTALTPDFGWIDADCGSESTCNAAVGSSANRLIPEALPRAPLLISFCARNARAATMVLAVDLLFAFATYGEPFWRAHRRANFPPALVNSHGCQGDGGGGGNRTRVREWSADGSTCISDLFLSYRMLSQSAGRHATSHSVLRRAS